MGDAGRWASAAALPCLNTNNCNEGNQDTLNQLSAGHTKTAFALKVNVLWLIERYGLERIGFLTLTFARHIVFYKEAQKALHSLMTGVLKARYREYIIVMERMTSGRIHYHLLVVMAQNIRTGFDFGAVKGGDYRSASEYLRQEWRFWRVTAPKYGFGRTELLPIKKTAEGVAKYVGKYVAKHIGQRLPEDKGARLVRYSRGTNRAGTRFSWVSPGAMMWRAKLGAFCGMLNLNSDNYQGFLKEWFGRNWVYVLGPLISSIKLLEFYTEEEASKSLRAAWVVAVNERERRRNRWTRATTTAAKRWMSGPMRRWRLNLSAFGLPGSSARPKTIEGGHMKEEQQRFLSLLGQLPARLTAEQAAWVLNCQPHAVPILVAARLLKPLGNPPPNSVKFFAVSELLELVEDRAWLARVTNALNQHWQKKNAAKKNRPTVGLVS